MLLLPPPTDGEPRLALTPAAIMATRRSRDSLGEKKTNTAQSKLTFN